MIIKETHETNTKLMELFKKDDLKNDIWILNTKEVRESLREEINQVFDLMDFIQSHKFYWKNESSDLTFIGIELFLRSLKLIQYDIAVYRAIESREEGIN